MLIPEKAPGSIKWKTGEEPSSLYCVGHKKGVLHCLSWDNSVS